MSTNEEQESYSKKDFMSDQMIRWCPGCGDYSILSQVQTVFANLGIPKEKFAVVSGIGCSSRFPYYMDTYGFHTIHGRAPAFATGLKLANPELSVWMITGDGDSLSIGGNHFIHLLRRNVDIQVLLFNNRIYGLTKGQYSPTSLVGLRTPSTPMGSLDAPVVPASFALGAGGRFIARTVDTEAKHLGPVFAELRGWPLNAAGCYVKMRRRSRLANFTEAVIHHAFNGIVGDNLLVLHQFHTVEQGRRWHIFFLQAFKQVCAVPFFNFFTGDLLPQFGI